MITNNADEHLYFLKLCKNNRVNQLDFEKSGLHGNPTT